MADINNWDGASVVNYDQHVSSLGIDFNITAVGAACPCIEFTLDSHVVYSNRIELTFNHPITLIGPALLAEYWSITETGSNAPMAVTSVTYAGSVITVYFTEGTGGAGYTLNLPFTGIRDNLDTVFAGPFTRSFNAVGVPPYIAQASSLDAFHVRVVFSEPVIVSDALTAGNYGIVPSITVYSVYQETPLNFVLVTSEQTTGTSYTVTVNNVRDLKQNPV